ncbi:MAG: glycosyltransferase family 9 protein [Gemmatimonadetes bacterium]|nr:glycosyltransferase family 9 protein [Gemmatimonadota bacterium]
MPGDVPGAPVRRALLIQLRNMGDVLLCTPAVRALREAYPGARIDFLTGALGADALAGNPYLGEVRVWRPGVREGLGLVRWIRGQGYDTVLDFQSMPRTARLVLASGAERRIGVQGRGPRNLAYTHLVPKTRPPLEYTAWRKLGLLEPLGIRPEGADALPLDIGVGERERDRAREIFAASGLEGDVPIVAVSPVSREPFKQWGEERWAEVADAVAAMGARILVTCGPGERRQAEAVARRMSHPAVWSYGRTTLRELAALYERCTLWMGNDGGPKHVAAAVGTPTLMVVRCGLGRVWNDPSPHTAQHFVEAPASEGCDHGSSRGGRPACLAAVAPERVIETAGAVLAAVRGGARAPLRLAVEP